MSDSDLDSVYVDLPDEIVVRLFDLCRAVAAGHGDSGLLQAEATHLRQEIDKLFETVVESELEPMKGD